MTKTPVLLRASAGMLAVLLSACGRGLPDAVPEGYERVGDHVAIRSEAARYSANRHVVPAAELFDEGDYTLFKLRVDCRDQFATESGARFGADGTFRGEVAARNWGKLDAAPRLRPAAEKLCALADDSRFVDNPDDDRAVMALLFADGHDNAWAVWHGPSAQDRAETSPRHVQILKKGRYTEGNRSFAYVITGANDPECTANACDGGILGAALFEQVDNRWKLRRHDPVVDVVGEGGRLPPDGFVRVLSADGQPPLLAIEWRIMKFGDGFGGLGVYGFVGHHFKKVLARAGWADTTGTSDCSDHGSCTRYATSLALGGAGGAWPELVAHRTGLDHIEGRAMHVDERTTYRFDGKGAYLDAGKTANNRPVVVPTPAQAEAMATMRPVVIDAVRAAWAQDARFRQVEILGLELEPESDAVYRGVLDARQAGQAHQYRMRIDVRPGPEYAWAFVTD